MPAYQKAVGCHERAHGRVPDSRPTSSRSFPASTSRAAWELQCDAVRRPVLGTMGRATPDLSADADPGDGLPPVRTRSVTRPIRTLLPTLRAVRRHELRRSAAERRRSVIDSALGRRVGFWNPAIYKFATSRATRRSRRSISRARRTTTCSTPARPARSTTWAPVSEPGLREARPGLREQALSAAKWNTWGRSRAAPHVPGPVRPRWPHSRAFAAPTAQSSLRLRTAWWSVHALTRRP